MSFFEKLTDGLRLYEVILMSLGAIMFIAMIIILMIYVSQRRELKPLFMFFAVPVLMLVWPSIQKIKIDKDGADIATTNEEVKKDIDNPDKKQKLATLIETLEGREVKDPDVVKEIAEGYYLLGNNTAAEKTLQKLPAATLAEPGVATIKTSIAVTNRLEEQIKIVQANPTDSNKVKELNSLQVRAEQLPVKSEEVTNYIKVADQKVTDYKRINPRVKMTATSIPR